MRKAIATFANRDRERLLGELSLSDKQCQVDESREHHGQTTTLRNGGEGISLADRGASDRAIPAWLVHAAHSSWDAARRCDDIPYFVWDHHPSAHCFAFLLAHHLSLASAPNGVVQLVRRLAAGRSYSSIPKF